MRHFKPGIEIGVSYSDYDQIPALRSHVIQDMRRSPAHCRYNLDHPAEATDAMVLGEAVHAAVLEPDRFESMYVARPDHNPDVPWSLEHKNSKAYKAGRAAWDAQYESCIILGEGEHSLCSSLRQAAWKHPLVKRLLTGKGANEVVACWKDPGTGLDCKARMDRLTEYEGHTIILDLKTTKNGADWAFSRDCASFGYHFQGAFYRRGLNVLDKRTRRFWIVALEKAAPYCVAVYELDPAALDAAEGTLQRLMYQYAECEEKGIWPGYPSGVSMLTLPKYAYYEEGTDDTGN